MIAIRPGQKRRCIGAIVLAYALAFWLDYGGTFIHRVDFDKAVVAYAKNPTEETQAVMERERRINLRIRTRGAAIVAVMEVGLVCGIWAFLTTYYKRKGDLRARRLRHSDGGWHGMLRDCRDLD
jgi:hypothetical protein